MKTTLTLFLSLCFVATFAQIPNSGFENWTDMGTYDNPDGWATMNDITSMLGILTCEKGTPGSPGSSYLKLTSKDVLGMGVIPAIAFTGTLDVMSMEESYGFPYTARPGSLTGKWQYMAYGNDQGMIAAALTKWNPTTQMADTVAHITYALPGMVMSWGNFNLPFTYLSGATPDSAVILFSTSGENAVANSYLYIDNLSFAGTAGIDDDVAADKFILSPNPASDRLSITYRASGTEKVTITIFDLSGKAVSEFNPGYSTNGINKEIISLDGLAAGSYILQLAIGNLITTDKLLIK